MRISDWSSDVCSSDLIEFRFDRDIEQSPALLAYSLYGFSGQNAWENAQAVFRQQRGQRVVDIVNPPEVVSGALGVAAILADARSEEHTSELQSLMRNSYAVFFLNKKTNNMKITRQCTQLYTY